MSITIKDCLKLPSLSLGKVVAGRSGLDSIVSTVSVIEFNDTDEQDIVQPNELLISALYCVKDDVDAQCRLITKAQRSGDVGLVLFYSDVILGGELSPKLKKLADYLRFPIIVMPGKDMGLKYSDVISEVTEAIYIDRKMHNYFVHDTIQRLYQSPEQDRTPAVLLQIASGYAKSAFFLCDREENFIASSFWPFANFLDFRTVRESWEKGDAAGGVYRMEFVAGDSTELVLYAASQSDRTNGAVIGEVVEAIQLFSRLWNYNLNLNTVQALIPAFLNGDRRLINYICRRNQTDPQKFNAIILIDEGNGRKPYQSAEAETAKNEKDSLRLLEKLSDIFAELKISGIIDRFGSHIALLFQQPQEAKQSLLSEGIEELLAENCGDFAWTSYASDDLMQDCEEFYYFFCRYLTTARIIYPRKRRFTYSDLAFAHRVRSILLMSEKDSHYYATLLKPVLLHPEDGLMKTLTTYLLDCSSEIKSTAETLFVHRNTVLYRLNKIRSLLECDLDEMPMAYDVYLAAAVSRVQEQEQDVLEQTETA